MVYLYSFLNYKLYSYIVVCPAGLEPKGCSESFGAGMAFTDHLS